MSESQKNDEYLRKAEEQFQIFIKTLKDVKTPQTNKFNVDLAKNVEALNDSLNRLIAYQRENESLKESLIKITSALGQIVTEVRELIK